MGHRHKGKKNKGSNRSKRRDIVYRRLNHGWMKNPESERFKKIQTYIQQYHDTYGWKDFCCAQIARELNEHQSGVVKVFSYMLKNLQK